MESKERDVSPTRRGVLVGAGGAIVAGASARAGAQEGDDGGNGDGGGGAGDESGGGNETADGGGGGGGTETVSVVDNEFQPAQLSIAPGTTVQWVWEGQAQHNVNPTEQPDGADWEGHQELQSEGEYEHTFEVEGDYHYVCDPHVSVGMEGDITVGGDGGGGGPVQIVPDAAWTLLIATVGGMVSVLSLAYAFLRFGGSGETA